LSTFCKGVCAAYKTNKFIKFPRGSAYENGAKYCSYCSIFMRYVGNRCPCCGLIMRTRPRRGVNKDRLLERIARVC